MNPGTGRLLLNTAGQGDGKTWGKGCVSWIDVTGPLGEWVLDSLGGCSLGS